MRKVKKIILTLIFIFLLIELLLRITVFSYSFLHSGSYFKNSHGKIKILCLGESTTFGIGAHIREDYPSQLNNILDKLYPNKFFVYNRGVPAITSRQMAMQIKRFMKETNPDLVILLCGANEYNPRLNAVIASEAKDAFWNNLLSEPHSIISHLKIYKLIAGIKDYLEYGRFKVISIMPKSGHPREFNEQETSLLKRQYQINIEQITRVIRNEKAEVIYSTYLYPFEVNYNEIKNAAYRNKVVLCDQVKMAKERNIPFSRLISEDEFHPNCSGYKLMAESLLKTLEESSILLQLLANEKNKHK